MRRGQMFLLFAAIGSVPLTATGCATFWDDVTSREFKVKELVWRPEPLTVLRTSDDGDARAKAMQRLKEPKAHGGSSTDQDEALQQLAAAATVDPRPLCRLAGIEALARFEDPRATAHLIQAYHNANAQSLTSDHARAIRSQALAALAHKKQPEAADLLVKCATQKPPASVPATQQASFTDPVLRNAANETDLQSALETQLAAIRALAQSHNPQAIPHLLPLLTEKDIAVRDRAYQALQALTGRKDIPMDPQAWQTALAGNTAAP